ncbi:hypothetical protein [Lonepinella koalarum]|uniref:hypothetical protein n=1 Tax=Lonepinella koalarum TaxID=53417 RepID=UPI003F6DAA80
MQGLQIFDGNGNVVLDATSRIVNMVTSFEIPFYIDYNLNPNYQRRDWFPQYANGIIKGTFTHNCITWGTPIFIPVRSMNWIAEKPPEYYFDISDYKNICQESVDQFPDFYVSGNTVTWQFNTRQGGHVSDYNYAVFGGYRVMVGFF